MLELQGRAMRTTAIKKDGLEVDRIKISTGQKIRLSSNMDLLNH